MIPTSENQVIYLGDGQTTAFAFNFKILERTDLHLIRVDKDGNESEVATDFYVDMATNTVYYPDYVTGGAEPEADRPPILMEGEKLIVYRDVPITQEIDFPEQWPFDVNEDAHDKSCIIDQQLKGEVDRAIKISRTAVGNEGEVNFNMTFPVAPNKTIRFNEEGNGFVLTDDPADVYPKVEAVKAETEAIKAQAETAKNGAMQAVVDARNAAGEAATNAVAAVQADLIGLVNASQEAKADAQNAANVAEAQKNEATRQASIATERASYTDRIIAAGFLLAEDLTVVDGKVCLVFNEQKGNGIYLVFTEV